MFSMKQPYIPINCSYYDYLEEAATLGREVTIEYMDGNTIRVLVAKIKTLIIKDKIEYMILEDDQQIRLDFLVSFNGKQLPKAC